MLSPLISQRVGAARAPLLSGGRTKSSVPGVNCAVTRAPGHALSGACSSQTREAWVPERAGSGRRPGLRFTMVKTGNSAPKRKELAEREEQSRGGRAARPAPAGRAGSTLGSAAGAGASALALGSQEPRAEPGSDELLRAGRSPVAARAASWPLAEARPLALAGSPGTLRAPALPAPPSSQVGREQAPCVPVPSLALGGPRAPSPPRSPFVAAQRRRPAWPRGCVPAAPGGVSPPVGAALPRGKASCEPGAWAAGRGARAGAWAEPPSPRAQTTWKSAWISAETSVFIPPSFPW